MFKSKATDHAVPQNSSGTQKKIRSVMRVKTLDESLHCSLHKQPLQKTKPLSLSVSFDKIHIREHAMILGDNPCVSQGPPVSIDWEAQEEFVYNIFEYEEVRGPARKTFQMVIPRAGREALLKKAGHSRRDFAPVIRQVNRTKNQRKKTAMNISSFKAEEKMEKLSRKMKGFFRKEETLTYINTWNPHNDDSESDNGSSCNEIEDDQKSTDSSIGSINEEEKRIIDHCKNEETDYMENKSGLEEETKLKMRPKNIMCNEDDSVKGYS